MAMHEIDVQKAKQIATEKGLRPAQIRDTDIIQFTKKGGQRFEVLDWNDFESRLQNRGLGIFESSGWMKIMKRD